MNLADEKWDFFIAHAGADTKVAENLYDLLTGSARVFLDSRSLELGDNWDRALRIAQSHSRITVVLVSEHSDAAYYERVEVASAITLSRVADDGHRVVPLFLDAASAKGGSELYGLNLKQGLLLTNTLTLEGAAFRLLATLKRMRYRTVLYDSRDGAAAQFRGFPNSFWTGKGAESRPSSAVGKGTLEIAPGGVLAITRTGLEGRFEVQLYDHESVGPKSTRRVFPATEAALDDRKIWIHCEARTEGARHGIRLVLKNDTTESWLANERRVIDAAEWTEVDVYFRIDPKLDFWFRIDDEDASSVPSRLLLRNIVLRERT
jgi:hypothetical protein